MIPLADAVTPSPRRRRLEATIRIIDVVGYLAVIGMGFFATFFSPGSVKTYLASGFAWVIPILCATLLFGGIVGATGRLTRIGLIEIPANTSALVGVTIYLIVIQGLSVVEPTAGVAAFAMIVVVGAILRRSVELQLFYSDAGRDRGFWGWLEAARTRRTENIVRRDRD